MRREDGSLSEMAENFCARVRVEWLPPGTLLLIGAGGQLARIGVSEYAQELTKVAQKLRASLPTGSAVGPLPLLFLNGSVDMVAIRAMHDIAMWLLSIEYGAETILLPASLRKMCDLICTTGSEMAQPPMGYRAVLPNKFEDPMDRGVWASEPTTELPAAVRPPTVAEEEGFIAELMCEINEQYRASLGSNITVSREVEERTPVDSEEKPMLIMVGNSHAQKVYEKAAADGFPVTMLQLSDMDRSSIQACARNLRGIISNMERSETQHAVIFSLFEHQVYRDQDGRMAWRGTGGAKHMRGNVRLADNRQLREAVATLEPLLAASGGAPKAIISPLPQYLKVPCCDAPNHCCNVDGQQFYRLLRSGLPTVARTIKTELGAAGLRRFCMVYTTAAVLEVPVEVAMQQPTTLSSGAYSAVLAALKEEMETLLNKRSGEPQQIARNVRSRLGPQPSNVDLDWDWSTGQYRSRQVSGDGTGRRE